MNFQKRILSNGVTVLHEYRNLSLVSVSITNKFGAGYEESAIKGIAHFIEHLVFTGTKTRTHEDISREIEKKGGVLNAFTTHETTSFWFKLPSEHLVSGLNILSDLIKNPKFDTEKFEKEKKVILEEIKMYHDNPRYAVMEQIEKNLFEKPFGELVLGSRETISALHRDFVFNYFLEHYNPKSYIVSVVGNAIFDKVCEYFEKNFNAERKNVAIKNILKINKETYEERSGIDQAHFVFAVHSPLPNSREYYTLEILDAFLASGMSSRLFLEIREKRGLAYTILSSINSEKNYSFYSIYVGTTKESVSEVKEIIIKEFKNIQYMTEKDLAEAKERIGGLRRIMSEESSNVMNELMFSELVEDARNYYAHEDRIREVSLADVKKLAKEIIKNYSTAAIVPK